MVEVEFTDEFADWWASLNEDEQISVDHYVRLLEERGTTLGHPYTSHVKGSRHGAMRELRPQHGGRPLRVLYAFDPRRTAILLIGGEKPKASPALSRSGGLPCSGSCCWRGFTRKPSVPTR